MGTVSTLMTFEEFAQLPHRPGKRELPDLTTPESTIVPSFSLDHSLFESA